MKKRFYRNLNSGLWNQISSADHYTLEPDKFTACVLLDFRRQAFYIFYRKQTDETTLEFCENEKEVLPRFEFGSLDSESRVLTTTP